MTVRRLVLIRHAKAKQGDHDLERPLARRGRDDARVIGEWLTSYVAVPDLVVVSPSLRTRQTWDGAVGAIGEPPSVVIDERVYDNTAGALVDVARDTDDDVATLAIVGHNPSVQSLAMRAETGGIRAEALLSFPTSTVAVLEFDGEWAAFDPRAARLVAIEICRGEVGRSTG